MDIPTYNVKLVRTENEQIIATNLANQKIVMTANGMKPELGFKAPEVVLVALGGCILVNLIPLAKNMGIEIKNPEIEITAKKRMKPLSLEQVNVNLKLESNASKEDLDKLFKKVLVTGTATGALLEGLKVKGNLEVK